MKNVVWFKMNRFLGAKLIFIFITIQFISLFFTDKIINDNEKTNLEIQRLEMMFVNSCHFLNMRFTYLHTKSILIFFFLCF